MLVGIKNTLIGYFINVSMKLLLYMLISTKNENDIQNLYLSNMCKNHIFLNYILICRLKYAPTYYNEGKRLGQLYHAQLRTQSRSLNPQESQEYCSKPFKLLWRSGNNMTLFIRTQ